MKKYFLVLIIILSMASLFIPRLVYAGPEVKHCTQPDCYMPDDNQIINFFSSNSDFSQKLNNLYRDMLKGKLNGEPAIDNTYDSNRIFPLTWSLWFEWQAMSTAFLKDDYIRLSMKNALSERKVDDSGFVYNGLSEEEIGWIFPNYQDSYGKSAGWEFNDINNLGDGWNKSSWVNNFIRADLQPPNYGISISTNRLDIGPNIYREDLNINAYNCPIIRIRMASQQDDPTMRVDWKTDAENYWSTDLSKSIVTNITNNGSWNTYNVLVYKNPKWSGTIKSLSVYLSQDGKPRPGLTGGAGIDFVRCAYDTRHSIDNTAYILGAWQYYLWTKDDAFLQSMLPKLKKVINFLGTEFQGDSLGYLQNPWWGHEGTSGIDSVGNRMPGQGIGSNWHDILPFGGKDGYLTSYYYRALKAMSDLDPDNRQTYLNKADLVKQVSDTKFWNSVTQRFTPIIDINNQSHDYGYTFANLEMLYNGLGDTNKAASIFNWLDGNPDIYKPVFAPRLSTERNNDWYMWQAAKRDWGQQIQDGGAALYYSYYDVMDRLKYKGADNAFNRFKTIVDWWDEVKTAGGVRKYYENGAGKNLLSQFWRLQGCGIDGGIGLDCEFPENVIVPTAFLYGFLGIEPKIDGLHIKPDLPSFLSWAGVENINYGGRTYKITADKNVNTVSIAYQNGIYQITVPAEKEIVVSDGKIIGGIPGDFNGDGKVNIRDYNQLLIDFGKTGSPGFVAADINNDGKVDIFDYNILVGNFGK